MSTFGSDKITVALLGVDIVCVAEDTDEVPSVDDDDDDDDEEDSVSVKSSQHIGQERESNITFDGLVDLLA